MSRKPTVLVILVALGALVAASCAPDDPLLEVGADGSDGIAMCVTSAPTDMDMGADDHAADGDDHDADGDMDGDMDMDGDDHDADGDDHDSDAEAAADVRVEIEMSEFEYNCVLPDMGAGTTALLVFTNVGAVEHEAVVGDLDAQNTAESEMAEMADMDMDMDDGGHGHGTPSVMVAAGETTELVVVFDEPGNLIIGCHIPGHWDAGMRTDFSITAA